MAEEEGGVEEEAEAEAEQEDGVEEEETEAKEEEEAEVYDTGCGRQRASRCRWEHAP
tara:strand:- start:201 stop:371 length:171 start_codon:yes stop_codon:yes gene_type:complete